MSRKLRISSVFAATMAFTFTVFAADGSGASAQTRTPEAISQAAPAATVPVTSAPLSSSELPAERAVAAEAPQDAAPRVTLTDLVTEQPAADLDRELECLAGAIYFEAKSETYAGQLAVGRVVVNRARSGRFPASYCGVVFQPSQFSFVRGRTMPAVNRASRDWAEAVAIARIAHQGSFASPAEGALFFHAASVSPNWRLTRVARVDHHVFYR